MQTDNSCWMTQIQDLTKEEIKFFTKQNSHIFKYEFIDSETLSIIGFDTNDILEATDMLQLFLEEFRSEDSLILMWMDRNLPLYIDAGSIFITAKSTLPITLGEWSDSKIYCFESKKNSRKGHVPEDIQ